MTDAPADEFGVDVGLVRRLLESQHRDLAGLELRRAANGWDNVMFRLGDDLAVRLPRRAASASLIEREQCWLPVLANQISCAMPCPVRVGTPAPELGFTAPWSVVPWLEGESAADIEPGARGDAVEGLARFVGDLAQPAPVGAPSNPFRGVALAARDEVVRHRLERGRVAGAARLLRVWERALAAEPWRSEPVWVHGDLHPANLIVGASGELAAVIDFGDLSAGDSATDLATAWLTFSANARRRFRSSVDAAGIVGVDGAAWDRARGWAVAIGAAIVDEVGSDGRVGRIGQHALEQVLVD